MARMIPSDPPGEGPGRRAERILYNELRDKLPRDFRVYHGLHYIEERRFVLARGDWMAGA